MYNTIVFCTLFFIVIKCTAVSEEGHCSKAYGCSGDSSLGKIGRYILYDVNPEEGFNLKRDVYMRMATFLRDLAKRSKYDWHLVLPPWTKMWHWESEESNISYLWRNFFDVPSLQLYSPVLELEDFFADYGKTVDEIYVLQHFPDFYTWTEGKEIDWSERWNYSECREVYRNESSETFFVFSGRHQITSKKLKCISFHGTAVFLDSVVSSTTARAIMFRRAEIVTHVMYGDSDYWMCRRSMRFAKHLVEAANVFRAFHLNSSDEQDNTFRPVDFREERPHRSAKGGPYLGVHLRRRDFTIGHPKAVPSLLETVNQIKEYLNQLNLTFVFIATDGTEQEYNYIRSVLQSDGFTTVRFVAKDGDRNKFGEGGLAIIDQIIASHAKYFVGTYESTFTYRIQEEREIMGFPVETTFNRFCPTSDKKDCTRPTKWLIKYPEDEPWKYYSTTSISNHFKSDEL